MSENVGERATGAETAVSTAASQSQADSQTSAGNAGEENSWAEAASRFDEQFSKLSKEVEVAKSQSQSVKDKRLAELEKQVGKLQAGFVSLAEQRAGSSAQASRPDSGEQVSATSAVQEMFVLTGLAKDIQELENKPEYISFMTASGGKPDATKAIEYIKKLKSGQSQVTLSEGAITQSTGETIESNVDSDALVQELEGLMKKPGNSKRIAEINRKLRESTTT